MRSTITVRHHIFAGFLVVLFLAAGCNKSASTAPAIIPTTTGNVQTAPTAPAPEQTKKPTIKETDPRQTPPTIPPYRLPGPPPEDTQPQPYASVISYQGQEGQTALALLKASHTVDTKTYSGIGEFVEGIDGRKGDSSHFWAFYVNGKQATVGASSYVTKAADKIEWKLEEIK